MEYRIDTLLQEAFGRNAVPAYRSDEAEKEPRPVSSHRQNTNSPESLLDVNIQMPIQIGTLSLPNEPLIEIMGANRIIATPVAGGRRKGTVKEVISQDDHVLRIRGIIVNDDNVYPAAEVLALRTLLRSKKSLPVVNAVCRLHGISRILFERWRFFDMEGTPAAQAYEIYAISDEEIELTLIDQLNL